MNEKALIQTLLAFRTQVEALNASINAVLFLLDEQSPEIEEPPVCEHPPESRTNLTTMGGPVSWQCRLCDFVHTDS